MGLVTEAIISEVLCLGVKAVQLRALKEKWPTVKSARQGGSERYYIHELLPVEVQRELMVREDLKLVF